MQTTTVGRALAESRPALAGVGAAQIDAVGVGIEASGRRHALVVRRRRRGRPPLSRRSGSPRRPPRRDGFRRGNGRRAGRFV